MSFTDFLLALLSVSWMRVAFIILLPRQEECLLTTFAFSKMLMESSFILFSYQWRQAFKRWDIWPTCSFLHSSGKEYITLLVQVTNGLLWLALHPAGPRGLPTAERSTVSRNCPHHIPGGLSKDALRMDGGVSLCYFSNKVRARRGSPGDDK